MKLKFIGPIGALIFALALPLQADAAVMTFEGVVSSSTYQVPVTPYSEAGFILANLQGSSSGTDGIFGSSYDATHTTNGSAVFFWCANCLALGLPVIELTAVGNSSFSLLSLDAAFLENDRPRNQSIVAVGNLVGGGTVTQTLDLSLTWTTFNFSGFDLVSSVDFHAEFSGSGTIPNPAIDNVVVSPVPLHSSWPLTVLSLAGVGYVAYRRRNNPRRAG
jgi:hypothetical protein